MRQVPQSRNRSNWQTFLTAIDTADKFVALDLSACPVTGAFDPDSSVSAGKDKIVSLILPSAATTIPNAVLKSGGNPDNHDDYLIPFEHFSALQEINGANITTIGQGAFYGNTSLETANFPEATSEEVYKRNLPFFAFGGFAVKKFFPFAQAPLVTSPFYYSNVVRYS